MKSPTSHLSVSVYFLILYYMYRNNTCVTRDFAIVSDGTCYSVIYLDPGTCYLCKEIGRIILFVLSVSGGIMRRKKINASLGDIDHAFVSHMIQEKTLLLATIFVPEENITCFVKHLWHKYYIFLNTNVCCVTFNDSFYSNLCSCLKGFMFEKSSLRKYI